MADMSFENLHESRRPGRASLRVAARGLHPETSLAPLTRADHLRLLPPLRGGCGPPYWRSAARSQHTQPGSGLAQNLASPTRPTGRSRASCSTLPPGRPTLPSAGASARRSLRVA
eukprot:365661-Chlamydomonas_euryale.AAC.33